MTLLILSALTLMLCIGGALVESVMLNGLCDWLFMIIRDKTEFEDVQKRS